MKSSAIRTVVLTVEYSTRSSYYLDWLDAFRGSAHFTVQSFNLFRRAERRAARTAIASAELVVALHACSADTLEFIEPMASALQARRGRLVIFIGNEYNSPWIGLSDKRRFIASVGADFVATQLPREAGEWLYEGTGARVLPMPHALNDAVFRRDKDDAARSIDIGGRSARYPIFLGDDERNRIFEVFRELGPKAGLVVDIDSTGGGRLNRTDWATFMNECRGTIGSEAGTWYLERDDKTVLAIREFLLQRSDGKMLRADGLVHSLSRRLPYGAKEALKVLLKWLPLRHEAMGFSDAEFAEVQARFFSRRPPAPVYAKCISSRHFDAAGTGTCQLLVRGRYNDILVANEHYLAVDPDFANLDEVLVRFRDADERKRVAENAQVFLRNEHTYRQRMGTLHSALN